MRSRSHGCRRAIAPQLDGLRALAVYLVVAFHAGSRRFRGGFIGVDVFFVLSGYLVTQLLLRDLDATGGIRFGRFYSRRFRRLLPAAFVALLVTARGLRGDRGAGGGGRRGRRRSRPRSSTSRTGSSSGSPATTSAANINANPVCTSGRWRSRSSSTWCGRCCSAASSPCTRRAGTRSGADPARRRRSGSRRRASPRCASGTSTSTARTTAPTRGRTSYSPGACSPCCPARSTSAAVASSARVVRWPSVTLVDARVLATSTVDVGPIARGAMVTVVESC